MILKSAARIVAAVVFLGLAPSASLAETDAAKDRPAVEGPLTPVTSYMLENGLEVVVIPDRRSPVVTHMVWYKVGSADEPAGKSGIAHFFEHLMFKGTKANPAGAFSTAISSIGGRENAFTSNDYTAYFQQVPRDALEDMMRFEADRMRGLVLTDEVIGPERSVVIEERSQRVENSPDSLLSEEVDATLYQNHPYGIPVIGWMHEIEELNREDAIAFYDRFYEPNNAVVVVAGDVEIDAVKAAVERTFGTVPRGPELPPRIRPAEPEQNTKRTVSLADARVSVPTMSKSWVVPSYGSAEPGEAEALDLLSEILGGGIRSRLYQELVVRQGIASGAGAYYRGTALDDSTFAIYGQPRGDATIDTVETAVMAEIEKIAREGVTEDELAAAKRRFLRSVVFAADDQSTMARLYGTALTTGGKVEDVAAWPGKIEAVTVDAVRKAAAAYLDDSRSVTGYLLPKEDDRT